MTIKPAFLVLPLLALLAACGGKEDSAAGNERETAAGEVLPGSISDEMLPLDKVRSQSPPQKDAPSSKATGAAAPAASPSAEASPTAAPEPSISLGDQPANEN